MSQGLPWGSSGEDPALPPQEAWAWSLVRELRSHMLHGMAKKNKVNPKARFFWVPEENQAPLGTGPWVVAQHHCWAEENPPRGQMAPSHSRVAPFSWAFRPQAPEQSLGGIPEWDSEIPAGSWVHLVGPRSVSPPGTTSTRGLWFTPCCSFKRQKADRGRVRQPFTSL